MGKVPQSVASILLESLHYSKRQIETYDYSGVEEMRAIRFADIDRAAAWVRRNTYTRKV